MDDLEVTPLLELANSLHRSSGPHETATQVEHDHLGTPVDARTYLEGSGFPVPPGVPSSAQLARLLEIRDLAHEILETDQDRWRAELAGVAGRHLFRFDETGRLTPASAGWDGFAASFVPQLFELDRQRALLRHCASPTCQWLFIDRSKNHSRVWCEMSTCGTRAKMSRYRTRRRRGDAAGGHEAAQRSPAT